MEELHTLKDAVNCSFLKSSKLHGAEQMPSLTQ